MEANELLVFDTSPLCHFASQGWLGPLKAVVGKRTAVVPSLVVEELRIGAACDSRVQAVLDASWIEHRELSTAEEINAFGAFAERLVKRDRNRGEAAVLALAYVSGGTAVVDDGAGRKVANEYGVALKPTLSLLCEAIRGGLLTVPLVSALADDLIASKYRLRTDQGSSRAGRKGTGCSARPDCAAGGPG